MQNLQKTVFSSRIAPFRWKYQFLSVLFCAVVVFGCATHARKLITEKKKNHEGGYDIIKYYIDEKGRKVVRYKKETSGGLTIETTSDDNGHSIKVTGGWDNDWSKIRKKEKP